jgi:NAD(P)-dependent dehydrogenase (short-subunit alcohol dehydrogenase family)
VRAIEQSSLRSNRDRAEAAAEKLRTANSDVHFVSIDVNDPASIESAAKTILVSIPFVLVG